jgi:serine/alanine adding enzyme
MNEDIIYLNYPNRLKDDWESYVLKHKNGSFWHSNSWMNTLENVFNYDNVSIIALKGEEVVGVLPLFITNNLTGGSYLISAPFANYAGVISNNIEIAQGLVFKAEQLSKEHKVKYVELRNQYEHNDLLKQDGFVTMILDLRGGIESVWKSKLKPKTRNQVRKAQKNGLTVHEGINYLEEFYSIYAITISKLGTPIFPIKMFKHLLEELKDSLKIFVVKYEGKIIGGLVFIIYGNTCYIPYASTLRNYNHFSTNNILYWNAIEFAIKKGVDFFDFGRSTINTGTFFFKKQWGADQVDLYYQYVINNPDNIPIATATNNKYKLAISVWKILPVFLTRKISSTLVKYLPEL